MPTYHPDNSQRRGSQLHGRYSTAMLVVVLVVCLQCCQGEGAPAPSQLAEFLGNASSSNSGFGWNLALSYTAATAIVGSTGDSLIYVYDMTSPGNWQLTAVIQPPTGPSGAELGYSVSVAALGNQFVAGAIGTVVNTSFAAGAAYVFSRPSVHSKWKLTATLTARQPVPSDSFGYAVSQSADGRTIFVGSSPYSRAGYVQVYSPGWHGGWDQVAHLEAPKPQHHDCFGSATALSALGDVAVVGAYCTNETAGAAYFYTRMPVLHSVWRLVASFHSPYPGLPVQFGWSVALSTDGQTALVGLPGCPTCTPMINGSVYVYSYVHKGLGRWVHTANLSSAEQTLADGFGMSVAINGDGTVAAVSAMSGYGYVYIFTRSGVLWVQTARLSASDKAAQARFGQAVALTPSGRFGLFGAPYASLQGRAYMFGNLTSTP